MFSSIEIKWKKTLVSYEQHKKDRKGKEKNIYIQWQLKLQILLVFHT